MPYALSIVYIPEWVLAALAVLLVVWAASTLFRPLLAALAQNIPYIGQYIYTWVSNVINATLNAVWSWVSDSVSPLVGAVAGPVQRLDALFHQIRGAISRVVDYVLALPGYIESVILPKAQALAQQLFNSLQSWAWGYIQWLASRLHDVYVEVLGDITNAIHTAESWAQQLIYSVRAEIQSWVVDEISSTRALAQQAQAQAVQAQSMAAQAAASVARLASQVGGLTPGLVATEVSQAVQAAEQFAAQTAASVSASLGNRISSVQAEADQLQQAISGVVSRAIAEADNVAAAARAQLEHEIAQAVSAARTYADSLARTLATEIDDVSTMARTAESVAADAVETFRDWRQKCGDPLCQGLSPLLSVLGELSDVIQDGLLLALIAEAVRDPEGTANAVSDGLEGVIEAATGTMNGVIAG